MKSFVRSIVPIAVATLVAMHFFSAAAAAQSADLSVQKYTFADPAAADANFTYFMDVFSEGPDDAQNVVLTDVLPPGVTFVSADSFPAGLPCTFDAPSHRLRCELGTLVAYDAAFIQMTVRAPSTPGTIVNTATVSSSTPDPNPDNNSSTASTEVVRFNLSDLKVTVTASANPVLVHRAVTFTTTVTNLGPHAAAGVQLSLSPPFLADILSVTPSQGTCTTTTDSIDCALGAMAIGASATLTLEVKPQTDGFALTTAFVSGYGDPLFFDPNSDNDFASVSVDVNYPGNADPALTQTSHQTIPYAALVENTCSGDIIYLSGTVREVVSLTFNKNRVRGNTLTDYHGITGMGLLSGKTYRASGGSRTGTGLSLVFNGWYPYEFTSVDKVRLVADDGERLWLHENLHLTINGNWTYTATVNNATVQCK